MFLFSHIELIVGIFMQMKSPEGNTKHYDFRVNSQ